MKYEVRVKRDGSIQRRIFNLSYEYEWIDFMSFFFAMLERGYDIELKRVDKREGEAAK